MWANKDVDVEIAVCTSAHTRLAAARNADALSVVHAARDVDLDLLRYALASCTAAVFAWILDDLACTVAVAASA